MQRFYKRSMGPIARLIAFVVVGCLSLATSPVAAQSDRPEATITNPDSERLTEGKIKSLQTQVNGAADLDEESKVKIGSVLSQALEELKRANEFEALAKADRELVQNVDQRKQKLQSELESASQTSLAELPENSTLAELESGLAQRLVQLQESKNRLKKSLAEVSRRAERRKQLAQLQASHAERIAEVEQQLTANAPSGESPWMTSARTAVQQAKLQSLAAEIPAYQSEIAKYDAEQAVDLLTIRVQQSRAESTRIEAEIDRLGERIDTLRKKQAQTQLQQLQDFAESLPDPAVKNLALRNVALAKENEEVVENIGKVNKETEASLAKLETLHAHDKRSRERVERVGLSGAIGLELRKQLAELPDISEIRRQGALRQEEMRHVELKRLSHEDNLLELQRLGQPDNADEMAKRIRDDYANTLRSLTKNYEMYFVGLSELDFSEHQRIKAAAEYRSFLDEHVLWIRSHDLLGLAALTQAAETLRVFFSPYVWAEAVGAVWSDVNQNPLLYGLALLALLLLLPTRFRGRDQLTDLGKTAERPGCTQFSVTARAAVLTFTMALVWPVVLVFVGWRLATLVSGTPISMSIGGGLISAGIILSLLDLLRQICRKHGLARSHFSWSDRVTELLRRKLRQLRYLMLPLVFLVVTLHEQDTIAANNSLERLSFAAGSLILAWALYGIIHPRRGVLVEYFQIHSGSWYAQTKNFWLWIVVGFPAAMAILALTGFYYTAYELAWRFWHMVWIIVCLVLFRSFMIRALQINHRKLRIQKAKERRVATSQEVAAVGEGLAIENEFDVLRSNSEQTLRIISSSLLFTGLLAVWLLWSGIFPAFRILDQWTLWETTREVAVQTPLTNGGAKLSNEIVVERVTLINLLVAVLIGLGTFTVVRNVPGLIEITILQRLPLDPSFKFAITMMGRYLILMVGLLLMFSAIGASWSKLQWLVAALTVGLGFGLQEIFGNLVSGIIILWERPIRIGDVVTIDGVSGSVARIQMRATTISDWDRKEYIVPNKDLVTGRLLNWTRSDQISRVVISVGVAYGSDVQLALRLLTRIASEHPSILDDPSPVASFDGFGDSTLDLTLRCFMPNLERRVETKSEIHLAIDQKFREAEIEIAFPQRDLHIRSIPDRLCLSPPEGPVDRQSLDRQSDGEVE